MKLEDKKESSLKRGSLDKTCAARVGYMDMRGRSRWLEMERNSFLVHQPPLLSPWGPGGLFRADAPEIADFPHGNLSSDVEIVTLPR